MPSSPTDYTAWSRLPPSESRYPTVRAPGGVDEEESSAGAVMNSHVAPVVDERSVREPSALAGIDESADTADLDPCASVSIATTPMTSVVKSSRAAVVFTPSLLSDGGAAQVSTRV